MPGKLPQQQNHHRGGAAGYSSYGNQIGLATGQVIEAVSSRLCGQADGDRRGRRRGSEGERASAETPAARRCHRSAWRPHRPRRLRRRHRLLQGARPKHRIETCGAEVQKGNPPTERKLQRLFRNARGRQADQAVQRLRCGRRVRCHRRAGRRPGHRPRRRAEKIRGTRTAPSLPSPNRRSVWPWCWTQGRCRAVHRRSPEARTWRPRRWPLSPTKGRLHMHWRGETVVDLSRAFLNTNGVTGRRQAKITAARPFLSGGGAGRAAEQKCCRRLCRQPLPAGGLCPEGTGRAV